MAKKKSHEVLEIKDLLTEVRNTNNRNHNNFSKLDEKLSFYFTLTTTILLLFVRFIELPGQCLLKCIYFLTIIILIVTLIILIIAYNPRGYKTIDTNKLIGKYLKKGYKNRLELLKSLTGTISDNTASVKSINYSKVKGILWCSWLIFVGIILIITLIVMQGVING